MAVLDGSPMGLLSFHTIHYYIYKTSVTGMGAGIARPRSVIQIVVLNTYILPNREHPFELRVY